MIRRVRSSLLRLPCPPSPRAVAALAGLALLVSASCVAATDTTTTTAVVPTSLTIDPATFLGNVACSNLPGALKSYVATLREAPAQGPQIELASSPPTSCSQPVSFRYVLDGHQYTVSIDGYDLPAAALVPCGGAESGSRIMLPAGTAPNVVCAATLTAGVVPVARRWQTSCGNLPSKPVVDESVVAACDEPFTDVASSGPTAITVDPRDSLGALVCTSENGITQPNGTITKLDVKADDANLNGYLGLPCDGTALKTYAKNLVPGATYTFHLAAHDKSEMPGTPAYTATCSAVAREGFTVPADCGPFTTP